MSLEPNPAPEYEEQILEAGNAVSGTRAITY